MQVKLTPQTCQIEGCNKPVHSRCSNCLRWICKDHNGKKPLLCSECAEIPESKFEKETVIVIPAASPYAFITTSERPWIRKLSRMKSAELLNELKDTKGRTYAYEFAVDKRCISLSARPRARYDKL